MTGRATGLCRFKRMWDGATVWYPPLESVMTAADKKYEATRRKLLQEAGRYDVIVFRHETNAEIRKKVARIKRTR